MLGCTHISTCHVLLLLLTVPMCKEPYIPYLVALASFKDLEAVAQEKSNHQTADVFVGDQSQLLRTW